MNFFEVETGLTNDDIENRVLYLINSSEFKKWVETKSSFWKSWINENEFKAETGNFLGRFSVFVWNANHTVEER